MYRYLDPAIFWIVRIGWICRMKVALADCFELRQTAIDLGCRKGPAGDSFATFRGHAPKLVSYRQSTEAR
jgi:hypothetical protein